MQLMTREEAAKELRVGLRTLDRRIASGEIQCYRLGKGLRAPVRISEEHLAKYLQEAQSESPERVQKQARRIVASS